ncbi:L,D-transpeptidase family protein, partial [Stenotrophomonas maltophilia]|uniref:L,D-transpeptidase family protein n=1 Tax=Stenotrophomonas maltophilia TaxID=40324 RepID=UPI0013DA02C3
RQPPGAANALGKMKFMFPNRHAIYLHDTPSRQYFGQSYRALSNGCVRVQNPEALAEVLLNLGLPGETWT